MSKKNICPVSHKICSTDYSCKECVRYSVSCPGCLSNQNKPILSQFDLRLNVSKEDNSKLLDNSDFIPTVIKDGKITGINDTDGIQKSRKITLDTFNNFTDNTVSDKNGKRWNKGKPKWSLVDFNSLEELVRVLEFGCKKYDKDNWKKGLKTTEICDSMLRHIYSFLSGEDNDKESNLSHIGHILCNAMFLNYMVKYKKEFDDRNK